MIKMNSNFKTLFIIIGVAFVSCTSNNEKANKTPLIIIENNNVRKPDNWIKERVDKAKEKLNSTEGGKLVWQSMEAHGGLENWFKNGTLSFRFDYIPMGKRTGRKTINQIDIWSNKAVQQDILDENDLCGWDGENAWVLRNDTLQFPFNVRFWALTPYYFLGQPFIFDGAGVKLEKLDDLSFDNKFYDAVKITFEAGTGDAPDDYYINLYDKETHLLKVLKYIVSYPSKFKNGGHSPEKTMTLHDFKSINGITLPTRYETLMFDDVSDSLGKKVTDIQVSQISFLPNLQNSYFEMREGAKVVE